MDKWIPRYPASADTHDQVPVLHIKNRPERGMMVMAHDLDLG